MNFSPLGDYILVLRCYKDDIHKNGITIYRDQVNREFTNMAKLIELGPKCKVFKQEYIDNGGFVWCPEWHKGLHRVDGEFFVVRERALLEKSIGGAVFYG